MSSINLAREVNEGVHKFKITNIEEKQGPSGYPYWILSLFIVRGVNDDEGNSFTDMLPLSPKARFRQVQFLDAVEAPKRGRATMESFIGKKAWGKVEMDAFNGKLRPKVVEWLVPPDMDDGTEDYEDDEPTVELADVTQAVISELDGEAEEVPF